jgi:hypothetical protein
VYEFKRVGDNTAYAMSQIADLHHSEPESPAVTIIDKRRVVTEPDLVGRRALVAQEKFQIWEKS